MAAKKTTKRSTDTGGAAANAAQRQQAQQPQNTTTGSPGLGALSKREQQNLGRWIGGAALLLQKAGLEVPMTQPA